MPPLEEKAKGLAAEDALTQARCAFILRHGHYADGTVHHWTPKGITKGDLWQQTENRALGAGRGSAARRASPTTALSTLNRNSRRAIHPTDPMSFAQ